MTLSPNKKILIVEDEHDVVDLLTLQLHKAGGFSVITAHDGADDYVTKPFSPREMLLRIKAILRRGPGELSEEKLTRGPITIDSARHRVLVGGKPVVLTAVEFKLLSMLMQRPGRVQARVRLLNEVWGYESAIDTRTVDTHV